MPLFIPASDKFQAIALGTALVDPGTTANTDVPNLTFNLPRAGTYWFVFDFSIAVTVNPTTIGTGISCTNATAMMVLSTPPRDSAGGSVQSQTVNDTLSTQSMTVNNTSRPTRIAGSVTVSAAAVLKARVNRSANAMSIEAGGVGNCIEK